MSALAKHLRATIAADGPLTVAEYMATALGHPKYGYYRKQDPLGRGGDFTTAPEISQVFGELLGLWCVMVWDQMGRPETVQLVELGPGRGTLMADMIRAAGAALPDFAAAASIHMVETSPALRKKQQAALRGNGARWHRHIDQVPEGPMIIVANEFFDALPIRQFVYQPDGWHERGVDTAADGSLQFTIGALADPGTLPEPPAQVGDIFETCAPATAIVTTLADRMVKHGGATLFVDYGHDVSAFGDTFQALKDHAYHPAFDAPGDADLTAHVDFAALARAAQSTGATAHNVITQGQLLTRLGIEARTEQLCISAKSPEAAKTLRQGTARLIDDDAMGTLFKALALSAPGQPIPPGFEG